MSGTVYGTLLNHGSALAALGEKLHALPYKAPPKAPVLYLKPRNTLARSGDPVVVPAEVDELEVGACLGLFIGTAASHLSEADALKAVAGYLIVNDVSVPHPDYFRPAVRHKARDGFCPLGAIYPCSSIANPDSVSVRVLIDGVEVQVSSTADLVRPVRRLLADVTEFMTLAPGDILAVGVAAPAPRARPGQSVTIEIAGLGSLSNKFVRAAA
jgi:5-oxopent-3-ene-1,2,5-tricarboxylate decarboxylase / 2-hydroxyhepta-2,4-diene-1,7-dioate isomerase